MKPEVTVRPTGDQGSPAVEKAAQLHTERAQTLDFKVSRAAAAKQAWLEKKNRRQGGF